MLPVQATDSRILVQLSANRCGTPTISCKIVKWRSLGKRDKAMNSRLYEIIWVRNASLFFNAF